MARRSAAVDQRLIHFSRSLLQLSAIFHLT